MRAYLIVFAAPLVWGVVAGVGMWRAQARMAHREAPDRHAAAVVGSDDCRRCHAPQYESWSKSHHRRMTQSLAPLATGAQVYAPFAGEQVDYGGFRATMTRNAQGVPHMQVRALDDSGRVHGDPLIDTDIVYTVGSHRYQQYVGNVEPQAGVWHRLPMAWHRGESRWIHLNGAFVEPEGDVGDPEAYLRHLSRWNDNCIFCHNTEPNPGLIAAPKPGQTEPSFATQLGEVGIACEACHGRGEAHVDFQADPFVRMSSAGRGDVAITHPERLTAQREAEVCGRCHGNRIAHDIESVLANGDEFVPGQVLAEVSRPILRDSQLIGTEGTPFAERFWPDGTPRLSAYEFQAMQMSACHTRGELRCGSCHTMHGDDPDMQLRPGARTAPCLNCHGQDELSAASGPGGHGAHEGLALRTEAKERGGKSGREPDCLDCHMPRVVYGLLEGMVTHRISSPLADSRRDERVEATTLDTPDACTRCHVDQTRDWARAAMPALRTGVLAAPTVKPVLGAPDAGRVSLSRIELELLSGDPLVRNLAAHALSRAEAVGDLQRRRRGLLEGLEDNYPSVRWFAWRGLREQWNPNWPRAPIDDFDYLAPVDERAVQTQEIAKVVGRPLLDGAPLQRAQLEGQSVDAALWIGE